MRRGEVRQGVPARHQEEVRQGAPAGGTVDHTHAVRLRLEKSSGSRVGIPTAML